MLQRHSSAYETGMMAVTKDATSRGGPGELYGGVGGAGPGIARRHELPFHPQGSMTWDGAVEIKFPCPVSHEIHHCRPLPMTPNSSMAEAWAMSFSGTE